MSAYFFRSKENPPVEEINIQTDKQNNKMLKTQRSACLLQVMTFWEQW